MSKTSIMYLTYNKNKEDEKILGIEYIENIDEILVPLNKKNTPIYITKAFSGINCKRWRVAFVLGISSNNWGIWLIEKDVSNDVYLSKTMANKNIKNPGGLLRKGCIVIVEFGYIYQTLNFQTGLTQSSLYPCNHQEGEMHKRRPCIVVKADKNGITIVPITSKKPNSSEFNRAIFELENDSTCYIKEFNPEKKSFALCEMIQTVSPTRILPPDARDFNCRNKEYRRDEKYSRRLSRNDESALNYGLLTAIGMFSLRKKNNELQEKYTKSVENNNVLTKEIDSFHLLEKEMKLQLEELKIKYQIISNLYLAKSEHELIEHVESEVNEYLSLDIH